MSDFPPEKDLPAHDTSWDTSLIEFSVSDEISLVHSARPGEGKTALMGKGLFLCVRGRVCTGGSAGFGVPVFRTGRTTFFPGPAELKRTSHGGGEMVFPLDRALVWHMSGKKAPYILTGVSERLVEMFMRAPAYQSRMLDIRDRFLALFQLSGRMLPVQGAGHCRVCFEVSGRKVDFRVDGCALKRKGRLIMLNEVDGASFDLLRSGGVTWKGGNIPAWKRGGVDAELWSPRLGVGISIVPEASGRLCERLFCGREVARDLNWAGIALAGVRRKTAYRLFIHEHRRD
ncbi:MAG: hypothetical protein BWZ01_00185 [Deltaproteobacteria bacterium ADurb.BinA179]|jgi:hypothetical protein|nr:hypothetical protein [Deltaproteobacteria bacterium]MDI9544104.1 hypothetical protein [Pseudomonadota bacterium]OPZ30056.1 MAG: hypothetical protein BWZ01_00185 [Deltaproteobacteria bacterium ADurb.BinA179]HRR21938.1 hypothetical protein [Desulfomonilia bacterium]HNR50098.1 hypothetical protein [Deltaproteobacteria bacterium]